MASKSLLMLEGEENICFSTGNEALVIRDGIWSHQQVTPSGCFRNHRTGQASFCSAGILGVYSFNRKMPEHCLTV